MKLQLKIALLTGALALFALPATAAAGQPEGTPPDETPRGAPDETRERSHGGEHAANGENGADPTPGPRATLPEKARAYGVKCRGESRERVAGERGTAFSQCVTAMARAASSELISPRRACAEMSRQPDAGMPGSPFSRCVRDAAVLQHQERAKAHGVKCRGESRERVAGERGTAFSRCVKAMARAANLDVRPGRACAEMSRQPDAGMPGSPFSRCVRDAARTIREQRIEAREQRREEREESEGEGSES